MTAKRKRARFTPELGQRAFELYKKYASYAAVGKEVGCDGVTAKAWIEKHKATIKQKQQTSRRNGVKKAVVEVQELRDANAFLEWWNYGERRGYVERLLSRLESETSN
jgi:transposase-like protein